MRWLDGALRLGTPIVDTDALYTIMTRLRISPQPVGDGLHPPWATIMRWVGEDHTRMIAVIEVVMDIRTIDYQQLRELERTLSDGGSMYTATENGVEERAIRLRSKQP